MPKPLRPRPPEQAILLLPPPSICFSDDHQMYFLLDLVNELDLTQILGPAEAKDFRVERVFDSSM